MNKVDIKVGMTVIVTQGKNQGMEAKVIEAGGCIIIELENGLEIEIHEDWIIEKHTVIKFYSSVASSGAKRKIFGMELHGKNYLAVFDCGGCLPVVPYEDGYIRARGKMRYH